MSFSQVGVEFTGSDVGAVAAAQRTAVAIAGVRREAGLVSAPLQTAERDVGKLSRGAVAGTGIFTGMGRSVAFASGAFLGGYGLLAGLRGAASELTTQVKLNAQAQAAIRSTGGVAGVTGKMMDVLAAAEMRKTGVDKQQIKAAEIMLLRYTNVRDVVGEGNDVFGRATKSALDLASATGTDVTEAATLLGKALQDPIKGASSLSRAHVALTAAEVAHIKKLGEEGKVLEAQKALLDAVAKSYGGTAEAVSNVAPWTRLQSTLKELAASAIKPLLPDIDGVVSRVQAWADHLANNRAEQERLKSDVEQGAHAVGEFAHGVSVVTGALGGWKTVMEGLVALKLGSVVGGWAGKLGTFVGTSNGAGISGAASRSKQLLTNLKGIAGIGALAVGVDLLFKSSGDKGGKGFFESLFGAGLVGAGVGFQVGGPWGAGLGLTIGVAADIYEHLFKGSAGAYKSAGAAQRDVQSQEMVRARAGLTADQVESLAGDAGRAGETKLSEALAKLAYHLRREGKGAVTSAAEARQVNKLALGAGGTGGLVNIAAYLGTGGGGGTYGENLQRASMAPAPGRSQILDCSSYVFEVFTRAGYKNFPDVSTTQWSTMRAANWASEIVGVDEAAPGDVVFYNVPHGEGKSPNHVGIVVSGRGRSAKVMQYTHGGARAAIYGIVVDYPIVGVKRFYLVKQTAGGKGTDNGNGNSGASSPDTGPVHGSSSSVKTITGSSLISLQLRGKIGHAADMALKTRGLVAAGWLHTEIQDLQDARSELERRLKAASGKQRQAIQTEIQTVDAAIARTQKSVASGLTTWIHAQLSTIEKQADTAFNAQTAAHIQNVLAPQFFQGTDAHGNQRLTPAEAELQAMQAQDTVTSLADQLTQAQKQLAADQAAGADTATIANDQTAVDQAQRQIKENELAIEATKERAQADADYAAAVRKYTAERTKKLADLNTGLGKFVTALGQGTAALGDLAGVLKRFGLPAHSVHANGHHHHGGKVVTVGDSGGGSGPTYVSPSVVPSFSTGESAVGQQVADALEQILVTAGGGTPVLVAGDVIMDGYKVGKTVARPVADATRRQISYTLQRG